MKVKNETKAVLVLKSLTGSQVSIKPNGSHSFKKEELSQFGRSVEAYIKSGWLSKALKTDNKVKEAKAETSSNDKEAKAEKTTSKEKEKPAKARKTRRK